MIKLFFTATFMLALLVPVGNLAQVANIAHRGGAALAPENTLAAFSNAIDIGADYFELDVQISADDSLMIMHDNTINRTTTGTGSVSSLTYAQLRTYDAGSKFSAAFAGEKIPTLYESLMLAKNSSNNIGVVIEIKTTAAGVVQKVVNMVQYLDMESRVIISSFTLSQITESKNLDNTIPVQLFVSTTSNGSIDQVAAIGGEWIGSGGTVTTDFLNYAHSKNVKFNSWTINSASQMISLSQLGVDGITTDNPLTLQIVSDTTPPSDVVLSSATPSETKIALTWQAASDAESDITGYNIYRDVTPSPTTLLATVGDTTEFTDETYTETQTYYYRIKAINGAGLLSANFSNEVSAATTTDVTKPSLTNVTSNAEDNKIVVEFSERVDQTTAETKNNYTINKSVTVESALLALDQKSVILTTSALAADSYKLTVKNVKDKAAAPNTMVTTTAIFIHNSLPASTVAYYSIDAITQDSVLADASTNQNNGVLKNGPTLSEGFLGNALLFDGVDDYVEFPSSPSFDINGSAVTVSLWTKLEYLPADLPGAYGPLFDSNSDQYVLYEDKGNNELRFKVSTSSSAERPGIPGGNLTADEWIHIVGVYDGTYAKIYLNGVLQDSHQLTGTVKTGQVAWLGRSSTSSPSYFQGSIDNVLILNTALSREEVEDLYNSTKLAPVDPRPTDVVFTSAQLDDQYIKLQWQPVVNYESTVVGYEIYRDTQTEPTTLHATAANVLEFIDTDTEENKTYYYRIKAKNSSALLSANFSNELNAATGQDLFKPEILNTTSRAETTKLVVEFNEKVDQTTSETIANYTLDNATVSDAELALDQKSVILTTSVLSENTYTLIVKNVKDRASASNTMLPDTVKFTHKNLPENIIAYYSMDSIQSDSVLTDYTANANNGTLRNGTVLSEGLLGNALQFDGVDDYVQFPISTSFDIGGSAVTVSLWVNLNYLPAEMPGSFGPLFDSDGDQYVIYADKGNKELRFKVSTTAGAERPGIPETDLITGQWINVVGVYDGTKAMVYLNGVLKDSHNLTGDVKPGQEAWLGRSAKNSPSYFKGSMDNLQIFNRALSAEEIVENYEKIKTAAIRDIVSVEENGTELIPLRFALLQNYPNPFNPTTTINYHIAEIGNVQLTIYDILGREVSTLINEVKTPGKYEVKFNGSNLSSGVYFYRLKAGSFIDTKKFVLIK